MWSGEVWRLRLGSVGELKRHHAVAELRRRGRCWRCLWVDGSLAAFGGLEDLISSLIRSVHSTPLEKTRGRDCLRSPPRRIKMDTLNDSDGRTFEILQLRDDILPTGLREDLVLVAWLAVLLRSREGSSVDFEWAYAHDTTTEDDTTISNRSMDKVMKYLQSSIKEVANVVREDITSSKPSNIQASSTPAKLVLSTSTLSRTSEGTGDEVCSILDLISSLTNFAQREPSISKSADAMILSTSGPYGAQVECFHLPSLDTCELWESWLKSAHLCPVLQLRNSLK